jgi:hypothetical protein
MARRVFNKAIGFTGVLFLTASIAQAGLGLFLCTNGAGAGAVACVTAGPAIGCSVLRAYPKTPAAE